LIGQLRLKKPAPRDDSPSSRVEDRSLEGQREKLNNSSSSRQHYTSPTLPELQGDLRRSAAISHNSLPLSLTENEQFPANPASNFTIVDLWRFWIIHLWVENFLELFVTCAVAIIFYQLGMVSSTTASRVVYLDALLYLGSGIIGRTSLVLHRPGANHDGA
jgi:hypothetical protein